MEDLTARAKLVDASEIDAQGVTATVPRSELESALAADDGPTDLVLDVQRTEDGGGRRIAVEWDRADLERLLSQAKDDAIVFAFEREPLALAFEEPEVEGHGLREKALVLTVAAATAAGAAGAAKAYPDQGEGTTQGGASAYTAIESARAGASAAEAPLAGFTQVEAARADAPGMAEPAAGHSAIEAARSAANAPDPLLGYAGMDTVGAEVAAEFGTGPGALTAIETARAAEPPPTSGSGGDGGTFAIDAPSPGTTAALAGAAALAITGAAFMARSRRRLTPQG